MTQKNLKTKPLKKVKKAKKFGTKPSISTMVEALKIKDQYIKNYY